MLNVPAIKQLLASQVRGTVPREPTPGEGPESEAPLCRGPVHFFPSLDSSNSKARELAAGNAPEGTVVLCAAQTAGRGRQGRTWISEPGKNLLLSIILRPRTDPELLGIVSLFASVSVAACVEKFCGKTAGCKWPNDVMVAGRKICGILSESVVTPPGVGAVILGIGLNVNQEHFPDLRGPGATSIRLETGGAHQDPAAVLVSLLGELDTRYGHVTGGHSGLIIKEWEGRSVILGSRVNVDRGGEIITGIARGLRPNGALRVETGDGPVDVVAGEVHLV